MRPPLRKVDTQIREAFQIFTPWKNSILSCLKDEQIKWLFDHEGANEGANEGPMNELCPGR